MKSARTTKTGNQGAPTNSASDRLARARDRERAHDERGAAVMVSSDSERTYRLYSFSDSTGALLDFKVLPDDDSSVRNVNPGVFAVDEASTVAPDLRTAYLTLVYGMMLVPRDRVAAQFWDRVGMIPRIRFAASFHIGLRGIGPALRTIHHRAGTQGSVL